MTGLLMKYFVLKPAGGDAYAVASRAAMLTYAVSIVGTNPEMHRELIEWIEREEKADD